jgi:hypothetical protein
MRFDPRLTPVALSFVLKICSRFATGLNPRGTSLIEVDLVDDAHYRGIDGAVLTATRHSCRTALDGNDLLAYTCSYRVNGYYVAVAVSAPG